MLSPTPLRIAATLLALAAAPPLCAPATAHGAVDQSYHPAALTAGYSCGTGGGSQFQEFTPAKTQLTGVGVYLIQSASATVTVRIRDGSPTSPVLATASAPFAGGGAAERHLDLPAPLAVVPGRVYVLELVWPVGATYSWKGNAPGGYADGQSYGCTALATPTRDLHFATYSSGCTPSDTNLCLEGGRFRVKAQWRTSFSSGQGHAVALTDDTGYFWFFGPENVEMVVKVLNACAVNDRYWVFAGGLTNQEVTWTVTDTQTDVTKSYQNPLERVWRTITDTDALDVCP